MKTPIAKLTDVFGRLEASLTQHLGVCPKLCPEGLFSERTDVQNSAYVLLNRLYWSYDTPTHLHRRDKQLTQPCFVGYTGCLLVTLWTSPIIGELSSLFRIGDERMGCEQPSCRWCFGPLAVTLLLSRRRPKKNTVVLPETLRHDRGLLRPSQYSYSSISTLAVAPLLTTVLSLVLVPFTLVTLVSRWRSVIAMLGV